MNGLEFKFKETNKERKDFGVLLIYKRGKLLEGIPVGPRTFREVLEAVQEHRGIDWDLVVGWGVVLAVALGMVLARVFHFQ